MDSMATGRDSGAHTDTFDDDDDISDSESKGERRRGRAAVIIALALIASLVAIPIGIFLYYQNQIDGKIERFEDPFESLGDNRPERGSDTDDDDAADSDGEPVTILVLGSDSRISAGDPSQWDVGGQRTDAIMLAQISGDRNSMTMMSIPRDSWVPIPGHGDAKINAAFSWGGPALMIQTVEQLTNVRIDHIAVTDFESFQTITDELGGVDIQLTEPLETGGQVLEPGQHTLNGEEALTYTRQRYGLSGGDLSRMQRQQNWMRAMMAKVFHRDILTSPSALNSLLNVVAENVAVDEDFDIGTMRSLALSMRGVRPDDVTFISAPIAGLGWSPDGQQSIVELDMSGLSEVSEAFAEDRIAEFVDDNPDLVRLGEDVE